jgi:hypothetical protein
MSPMGKDLSATAPIFRASDCGRECKLGIVRQLLHPMAQLRRVSAQLL